MIGDEYDANTAGPPKKGHFLGIWGQKTPKKAQKKISNQKIFFK